MGYPNMSYCMCENTLAAMEQVIEAMRDQGAEFCKEMSREEKRALADLVYACQDFLDLSEELALEEQDTVLT